MKSGFMRTIASLEGVDLVISASEIQPDKRSDLWWQWPHERGATVDMKK